MAAPTIQVMREEFPIAGVFRISRGAKSVAEVVVCQIEDGQHIGNGECVPYARYGETLDSVCAQITSVDHPDMDTLEAAIHALPAGAARNALDCALWDIKSKIARDEVGHGICKIPPRPIETAYTLSLDTPNKMATAARAAANHSILKIKLGGEKDIECMHAVVANAPGSKIIIDANEAWRGEQFRPFMREASKLGIALIEQPLPADDDEMLRTVPHPVPVCADESAHTSADLPGLMGKYDFINIKLDKAGGLTEAMAMRDKAHEMGFGIMVGCMVGSSLAMAPAVLLAQDAEFVDLDGPLLLAKDRSPALHYYGNTISPPDRALWG